MHKFVDIGLFKTPLAPSARITEQLTRVKENPGPGQYTFDEDLRVWTLHPEETGHFTGNYLSTETEPGTAALKMREVADYSWTVSAHTIKLTDLPGMKAAMLEAQLAEAYVRTMYPEHADTIMQNAGDDHPVWQSALRYVRFFIAGVALLKAVQS